MTGDMTDTPVTIVPDDATLLRMADELATQQRAFHEAFQARFAPGERVSWEYGGAIQHGRVLRRGGLPGAERLKVGNDATGKAYWIHAYRVMGVLRERGA